MRNKIILVTGGTSGIGKALVALLHAENQVIVCSRNQDKIAECEKRFRDVLYIQADISNIDDLHRAEKIIAETYGRLDILFANAGVANFFDLDSSQSVLDFRDMEVNFKGTVQTVNTFKSLLLNSNKQPTLVITNSILAKIPHYKMPIYSASKAALHSYCTALRSKIKRLTILEIFPPLVDTPMTKDLKSNDKMKPEKIAANIVSSVQRGKKEVYPGVARLANLMSIISFKRISKIINSN
ncbi:MAG: SDR family NAD(P)-dependent oxidoreductase [Bacteroidota bacterium]